MSKRSRLLESSSLQSPSPDLSPQSPPQSPLQSLSSDPLPNEIAENVNQSELSLSPDSGDHLDGLAVDGDGGGLPQASDVNPSGVVSLDQFTAGFVGGFNLAGHFVKALAILPEETGKANEAAAAIYNTALEVEQLRFLIAPQGKWIGRGAAVLFFAGPKFVAARDEIRERRQPKKAPALSEDDAVARSLAPHAGPKDEERSEF